MTRVLIVSGIWPPDVGGPASHGPELGRHLTAHGHDVTAVVSADVALEDPGFALRTTRRDRPLPLRMAAGAGLLARAVREAEVVYATGMYHRAAAATAAARVPLVMKLVNDPAFERARNRGWFGGTLEDFQHVTGDRRFDALRRARSAAIGRADALITPSAYLGEIVRAWGPDVPEVTVISNPAVVEPDDTPRNALRAELGFEGPTAVFAGRFVLQKDLPTLVEAMSSVDGLQLVLVGDGPELEPVTAAIAARGLGDRIRLLPPVSQRDAGRYLRAADLSVLPSSWENFPHAVVESLAVGTPVVACAVGGVPEILTDGVDGWLVAPGDPAALAAALNDAVGDPARLAGMRVKAAEAGARYRPDGLFDRAEALIERAAASSSSSAR